MKRKPSCKHVLLSLKRSYKATKVTMAILHSYPRVQNENWRWRSTRSERSKTIHFPTNKQGRSELFHFAWLERFQLPPLNLKVCSQHPHCKLRVRNKISKEKQESLWKNTVWGYSQLTSIHNKPTVSCTWFVRVLEKYGTKERYFSPSGWRHWMMKRRFIISVSVLKYY